MVHLSLMIVFFALLAQFLLHQSQTFCTLCRPELMFAEVSWDPSVFRPVLDDWLEAELRMHSGNMQWGLSITMLWNDKALMWLLLFPIPIFHLSRCIKISFYGMPFLVSRLLQNLLFICEELVKTLGAFNVNKAWSCLAVKLKLNLGLPEVSCSAQSLLADGPSFDKGQIEFHWHLFPFAEVL